MFGDSVEFFEELAGGGLGHVSPSAEVAGQHAEHGDLSGECFGAGDADLGADVEVDAGVGLAGDG